MKLDQDKPAIAAVEKPLVAVRPDVMTAPETNIMTSVNVNAAGVNVNAASVLVGNPRGAEGGIVPGLTLDKPSQRD